MKRLFIILLFFISLSITAEELHNLTNNVTDIRNKVWYYGTNSFNEIDEFLFRFNNQFVKKIIVENNVAGLTGQNLSILRSLTDRGDITIPAAPFIVTVICDNKYGVVCSYWYDTSSFGDFQDTGLKLMLWYFFELK